MICRGMHYLLTVYNYNGGPCYRFVFPTPPPTNTCQRCAESGVLRVGIVIGCLQALEAIKVARLIGEPPSRRMLLLDVLSDQFRNVKLRGRSLLCEACGDHAVLTRPTFLDFNYDKFNQTPLSTVILFSQLFNRPLNLNLLSSDAQISSIEHSEKVIKREAHVLVDVRPAHVYKIVSLSNSMNIPLSYWKTDCLKYLPSWKKRQRKRRSIVIQVLLCCNI
ncbi:Adenylyltransferase and sulfurtransferase MOCS3 [Capsicum annuum]|uniref:Adenylyltransferase and sulfurtransferase MOCS3 n=1 Tax=Capsicum annuum TaxID=4072 RepID=A0A2G2YLS3_CAPAN|nr:Adenylyltransferase and sulfurtransferase MOCS3 [Capsicum annuum]